MTSKGGYVRMTISLPGHLKNAMDNEVSVNWSRVAAQAFEAKLLELKTQIPEVSTMEEVVSRLKAAKEVDIKEAKEEGFEDGKEFAMTMATPRQLKKINELRHESHIYDQGDDGGWYASFEYIAQKCGSDIEAMFGEDFEGDKEGYLEGWIDGAMSIWHKVEDQV